MNSGFRGMSGRSRVGGFNLIELLITLAVISLAIGVGVPMYSTFTQESSVSGATSELVASFADARSRAAAERGTIRVRAIEDDWVRGWQIVRLNNVAADEDDEVLFTIDRKDTSISMVESAGLTEVDFNRDGRTQSGGVVAQVEFDIRIANGESGSPVRTLTVSPLGRVNVEKSHVN